jgi:ketosteroid isomerase-like protein
LRLWYQSGCLGGPAERRDHRVGAVVRDPHEACFAELARLRADRGQQDHGLAAQIAPLLAVRRLEELARRFFAAAMDGDLDGLLEMLSADAVAYADGGGVAPASRRPVHGGKKVAHLLLGAAKIGRKLGVVGMREVEINGEPGCVFEDGDGHAIAVVALNIADDQVQTIHAVANPEKLHHLGRSKP